MRYKLVRLWHAQKRTLKQARRSHSRANGRSSPACVSPSKAPTLTRKRCQAVSSPGQKGGMAGQGTEGTRSRRCQDSTFNGKARVFLFDFFFFFIVKELKLLHSSEPRGVEPGLPQSKHGSEDTQLLTRLQSVFPVRQDPRVPSGHQEGGGGGGVGKGMQ